MKLHELTRGVPGATVEGNGDVEITGIAYDSRRVKPGDLFVAVEGLKSDGHAFVSDALARGAAALAVDRDVTLPHGTPGGTAARLPPEAPGRGTTSGVNAVTWRASFGE